MKRKKKSGKVAGFEKKKIRRSWKLRNLEVVPLVIGGLASASAEFDQWMGKLGITCNVGVK